MASFDGCYGGIQEVAGRRTVYPAAMPVNESGPQEAVGAICVRRRRLLLVQRGGPPAAGRWSVPGGRVRPGETREDAVLRELAEETGLRGRLGALCGVADRVVDGHHYRIHNYWVDATGGDAVAGDDAAAVRWASRAELAALDLVPLLHVFLDEHGVLERLGQTS